MHKNALWLLIPIGLMLVLFGTQPGKKNVNPTVVLSPTPLQKIKIHSSTKGIFIPYWASELSENDYSYNAFYYFGIAPTKEGMIEKDGGYQNMTLVRGVDEKKKKLVLRMLDASITEVLLESTVFQKKLNEEVLQIMDDTPFSGIVIDMEVPFTLQSDKQKQITNFVQQMCTAFHANYKSCDMLIYGDFAYRKRPYDLKKLGEITDKILLMAYDFHKAGGEPGPNFPFDSGSTISSSLRVSSLSNKGGPEAVDYGYDFKTMISDATALVPQEKIEVVFGMYGYNWTMNEQGTPLQTAQALSLNEIKTLNSKMLHVTSYMLHVNDAQEKNIQYTDNEGRNHIIWYEDEESAAVKIKYLQEQGIGQASFWAYGYY